MLPVSPLDQVRSTFIASFYQGHRPELADLVASADLELDLPGLWITAPGNRLEPALARGTALGRRGRKRVALLLDPCRGSERRRWERRSLARAAV
jgi:hypothetical protein